MEGGMATALWADEVADYSPAVTLIRFDPPVPLLRGPVAANNTDVPSSGPFVLVFRNKDVWRSAFISARSKVMDQSEAGARVGCSIAASNKCRPPWWKCLFGSKQCDLKEREECEEREMASCLASSKEACVEFAKGKLLHPFSDARIACSGLLDKSGFEFWDPKIEGKLFDCDNLQVKEFLEPNIGGFEGGYYRASVLLGGSSAESSKLG